MHRTTPKLLVISALLALCGACATGPSVQPQLSQTNGAVRAADEMDAAQLPEAALHLKLARENLKRGEALMEEDEMEARRVLERAQMDAEVAIAHVKAHQAEQKVEKIEREIQELQAKR